MAKPLGPKATLIREAINAHPRKRDETLADLINASDARKEDGIRVTANDVSRQRQAMKKLRTKGKKEAAAQNGAPEPAVQDEAPPAAPVSSTGSPVDLMDRLFDLATACGGIDGLKR